MPVFYAGIGSRETPPEVLERMERFATFAEGKGLILRSGGAKGADSAFERSVTLKQIFLPEAPTPEWAYRIAQENHPNWGAFKDKPFIRDLMARNTLQVYGPAVTSTKSAFVLCWTPDGAERETKSKTGGTGQAIRLAIKNGIPVFNMKNEGWDKRIIAYLKKLGVDFTVTLSEQEIAELAKIWCTEFIPAPDLDTKAMQNHLFFELDSPQVRIGKLFTSKILEEAKGSLDGALRLLLEVNGARCLVQEAISFSPKRICLLPSDFAPEVRETAIALARRFVNFAWDMTLSELNVPGEMSKEALFRNYDVLTEDFRAQNRKAYALWQEKKAMQAEVEETIKELEKAPIAPAPEPRLSQLTPATAYESKVAPYVQMLLQGATDAEVAALAGVVKETVAAYRKRNGIRGRSAADRKQARQATEE